MLDNIKIKNFCSPKDTIKSEKTTHIVGQNIHISRRYVKSRICAQTK